jgi:pyruvate formate lyase activating enzyme
MNHPLPSKLKASSHPARLWSKGANQKVHCHLSPRECKIPLGGLGFCGVRANIEGQLVTLNYGKSVHLTKETIETEAVFHYAPGSEILSLGNIGCMMHCDFCHNWSTSQARLAQDEDIYGYDPQEIVDYALRHQIPILSWTYNDPVVWHEFVLETAKLAQAHGIKNLYKSAFYITPQAIEELLEVIDIFSISLKSMDPVFYRKITKGELEPVLQGIQQVYRSCRHLEISNLVITERNDTLEESNKIALWILEHLSAEIPLHYVRFHPDYKYNQVTRTSIPFLEEARLSAKNLGMKYVYLGNMSDTPSVHTFCDCGTLLVERYGLNTKLFLKEGACPQCHSRPALKFLDTVRSKEALRIPEFYQEKIHRWQGNKTAIHVRQVEERPLYSQFFSANDLPLGSIQSSSCQRFILSKPSNDCVGVRLFHEPDQVVYFYEIYDRAHFPTQATPDLAVD